METRLSESLQSKLDQSHEEWKHKADRLWTGDESLWTRSGESNWLGWLTIVDDMQGRLEELRQLTDDVKASGFTHVVVLGMGGSSLCPDVLARSFGTVDGSPQLLVLDSTDPAQVMGLEGRLDLARTLFIVSSKSGSTLEPSIFEAYFYERMRSIMDDRAGSHFIAITDPGSQLEKTAQSKSFRHILHGVPSIGGRFSALSMFGMAPAAAMGLDVARILDGAAAMANACRNERGPDNPGVALGVNIGELTKSGRDKLTFIVSPPIESLGEWLEQLLAESTGKNGKAVIPVDGERIGNGYGDDRVFAYIRLRDGADSAQDTAVEGLESAGHPVIRLELNDRYELGSEFFRWEVATAVAGSILELNPFDQPDVEASKIETRTLTDAYEQSGSLPPEEPIVESNGIRCFADAHYASELVGDRAPELADMLRAHLERLGPGDYFAVLAYIDMNDANDATLQEIRHLVRDRFGVATCLGFGPRFLHSTGQAYKGGPNSGVFLQLTCDDANDLAVPGRVYTFGVVKAAQARGDFEVLAARGRRALRLHVPSDVPSGLRELIGLVRDACAH